MWEVLASSHITGFTGNPLRNNPLRSRNRNVDKVGEDVRFGRTEKL